REDGTLAPRFRGRLLFPIHDQRARIVGFGGRILGEGEPKYLNSPDTPIFHKGRLLYNLHAAKHAIRKAERAILVEGYFDVLRLALAGVEEVVAPLGTGLTSDQAQLLQRHAPHVILLYDSDEAGLRATFRAGDGRSIGCCLPFARRRIRSCGSSMSPGRPKPPVCGRMCWSVKSSGCRMREAGCEKAQPRISHPPSRIPIFRPPLRKPSCS